MEQYLNKGIKEIIREFPQVGDILNEFHIGCAPCNVGTCLLKDIVEVHNLPIEAERALMERISRVIYPNQAVEVPMIERKAPMASGEIKYSPAMKALVDEHTVIKRLLALIPQILEDLDLTREEDRNLILDVVDFIRSYADRYHHAKEEDILFKAFDEGLEIVKAMHEEHRIGRGHVKAVMEAVETEDTRSAEDHLTSYGQLLAGHIRKEDEVLYPWMDRNLSTSQVGALFARFAETDKRFSDTSVRQKEFIRSLETKFSHKEVTTHV
ncbi:MAG TPA: hemerythrin domain-containing protein [Thermodesulfovibrionales bacterium]|nr:hemerythrin domain-containing protein [Thermodesulfovibrionales bacterium]